MAQSKDHTVKSPVALECICASEYQDKKYGNRMRLHNPMKDKSGFNWRCTVCGRQR